ncbi:MAG: YhjD/YihY/BrkB family envelope integrity protein [Actinomyces sp.]|uniref:YihY/virulence factor BrkB family protein n=1 Tax=Actinomyces sp. TaxID=29317 RepID=UPI0026DBEE69|nr:YhjD/YihY/BrkB family envelope integrity protein [Actinomyces sp.]MDO4242389.1 YhjD/YihY/BrkB family envelope integrity protein [Actinomyces sp.]
MQALRRLLELAARLRATRAGRALGRYSTGNGALLAGGIAYTGLFSAFAALAIAVSALMGMLRSHDGLRSAVLETVDTMLPGAVDDGSGTGLVTLNELSVSSASSALSVGGVVGGLVLLYTATGFMGALTQALRAMFGLLAPAHKPVIAQLWNLVGFVVVVLGVLLTAIASLATAAASSLAGDQTWVPAWLAGGGTRALAIAVSAVIDGGVLALIITISGVRPPRRDLVLGCLLAAAAFGVMRQLGTGAVASTADNPLLASAATVAVLIVWLHLASRIVLLVAAWIANPPPAHVVRGPEEDHAGERPNYMTLSVPQTLTWTVQDTEPPDTEPPDPAASPRSGLMTPRDR